jgi:hypothetical protein
MRSLRLFLTPADEASHRVLAAHGLNPCQAITIGCVQYQQVFSLGQSLAQTLPLQSVAQVLICSMRAHTVHQELRFAHSLEVQWKQAMHKVVVAMGASAPMFLRCSCAACDHVVRIASPWQATEVLAQHDGVLAAEVEGRASRWRPGGKPDARDTTWWRVASWRGAVERGCGPARRSYGATWQ